MALDAGRMAQAIFEALDKFGMTQEDRKMIEAADNAIDETKKKVLPKIQDGWRRTANAIALGVIQSIKNDMEIHGITVGGKVINLNTDTAFTQNDDGKGHVT